MLTRSSMDKDKRFRLENAAILEIGTLKRLFEKSPAKTTIIVNCKCSSCGNDIIIDITHTSGGFGLNGGMLFEYAPSKYLVKCLDCGKFNKKTTKY